MVHGRPAYMVACGPRTNGSKPGRVSACDSPSTSRRVYRAWTVMPAGVTQFRFATSPPGADLAAAFFQPSREVEFGNGALMGSPPARARPLTDLAGIATHVPDCGPVAKDDRREPLGSAAWIAFSWTP